MDYGPFRFIDTYDPDLVSNGSDDEGLYRLSNQPAIVHDNLGHLLDALSVVMTLTEKSKANISLTHFNEIFAAEHRRAFLQKLGFQDPNSVDSSSTDLIHPLLRIMAESSADFTASFHQLGQLSVQRLLTIARHKPSALLLDSRSFWAVCCLTEHGDFANWVQAYATLIKRGGMSDLERMNTMRRYNPRYVLRNWIAESIIRRAENGDFQSINDILAILQQPYTCQFDADYLGYADPPPNWANNLTVTCSS